MDYKDIHEAALRTARQWIADGCTDKEKIAIEAVFPELRESEDERIRKALICHLNAGGDFKANGVTKEEMLAYLENQKEQKPAEPSDDELQRHQDELYNFKVFAAKQAREHYISFVHDFEWNNFCAELLSYFNEMQKQEWSEEDERIRQKLIQFISSPNVAALMLADDKQMFVSWLKALRPMPKVAVADGTLWKPSEEQMDSLDTGIYALEEEGYSETAREIKDFYEDLKKLMEK